jgi:hypothetical protein
MTAAARCEHTDLLVDECAHCTGRDGGEEAERRRTRMLLTRPGVIAARFAGFCSGCHESFRSGDPIASPRGLTPPEWRGPCCIGDDGRVIQ